MCSKKQNDECFLMVCALTITFPPPFITAPLTSILGTTADVHRVSCWLLHFGETAPASDCWPWCILFLLIFMAVSVDTRCLAGTGRWPGDGRREEGSWTGENSLLICGNKKNQPRQPLDVDTLERYSTLWSEPVCQMGTNHRHVQQVVDLQLLVDTLPVLLHLLFLLPGLLQIALVHGTLLFHVIPGQTLSHLKPSQQERSLLVSWHLNPAEGTIWKHNLVFSLISSKFLTVLFREATRAPLGHLAIYDSTAPVPHHCTVSSPDGESSGFTAWKFDKNFQ